jgi:F-type H+-transporting ATPase subunit delta
MPVQAYYNAVNVKQVDVPTFSGYLGILPHHVPILAALKPGVVTVYGDDGDKKFFGECTCAN